MPRYSIGCLTAIALAVLLSFDSSLAEGCWRRGACYSYSVPCCPTYYPPYYGQVIYVYPHCYTPGTFAYLPSSGQPSIGPNSETGKQPSTNTRPSDAVNQIVQLTNAERNKAGLKPLKLNATLSQVAQQYAAKMAQTGANALRELGDNNPKLHELDGKKPQDRITAGGYKGVGSENVYFGDKEFSRASEAVKWWMNSEGHRKNILTPDWSEIGVGVVGSSGGATFYVQVFAKPEPDK
jgi:uncharacterized protein YkwD